MAEYFSHITCVFTERRKKKQLSVGNEYEYCIKIIITDDPRFLPWFLEYA